MAATNIKNLKRAASRDQVDRMLDSPVVRYCIYCGLFIKSQSLFFYGLAQNKM